MPFPVMERPREIMILATVLSLVMVVGIGIAKLTGKTLPWSLSSACSSHTSLTEHHWTVFRIRYLFYRNKYNHKRSVPGQNTP